MRRWKWMAVGVPALLASGCGEDNALPKEWVKTVRQYNYIAVWPARKDLQVGDIYAVCDDSDELGVHNMYEAEALPRLLGRLDVKEDLRKHYEKSVVLPKRPITPASGAQARPAAASDAGATVPEMTVALPDLGSVTVKSAKFGASLPAGAFLGTMGLSSDSLKSVSMSVPSAVSYGLPHDALRALIKSEKQNNKVDAYAEDNLVSLNNLARQCKTKNATLIVISEVVAAYAIQVSMEFKEGTKAAAKVAMLLPPDSQRALVTKTLGNLFGVNLPTEGGGNGGADKPAAQSEQTGASAPTATPPIVDASKPLAQRTKEVVDALVVATSINKTNLGPDFPGVSASFSSASDSQLSMDTRFESPVTYAFRYMALCHATDRPKTTQGGNGGASAPAVGAASATAASGASTPAAAPPPTNSAGCGENQVGGGTGSPGPAYTTPPRVDR
nr:hypothetical protein [uncultured Cupriavidus sp.]